MDRHKELLEKLSDLMLEYNAEFSLDYSEGCECCGGDFTLNIETVTDGKWKQTSINSRCINGHYVKEYVK